jgi:ribosomal protein L14E/L6E/L27E
MNELKPGQLVISKAGRDKGKWYVVYKVEGPWVYIVDGKTRRLEKPKKKNLRHLQPTHKEIFPDGHFPLKYSNHQLYHDLQKFLEELKKENDQ